MDSGAAYSVANFFTYATPGGIIAAAAALPAIGIVVVALRFYTRFTQKARLGLDDFFIVPALALVIGMGVTLIVGEFHSLMFMEIIGVERGAVGYPTPPPPNADPNFVFTWRDPKITLVQKVQFITQLLMTAAYGFIKLSIVFFYRRIFVTSRRDGFDVVTKFSIALIVAWTLAYIFAVAFDCDTVWSAHWGSYSDLFQYCHGGFPVQQIYESLLITDLITDVLIILLPLPKIWTLHLSLARKAAITGIFLLGAVAVGAAAARLAIFVSQVKRSLDPTLDENQSVSTVMYWSMIEAGLSLIAACLPTTQHLFHGISLASVVASVRSAISLSSLTGTQNSGGSRNRPAANLYGGDQGPMSGVSEAVGSSKRLAESESQGRSSAASEERRGAGVNSYDIRRDTFETSTIEMTTRKGMPEP
ncbi:hypothetical protein EKO27_g6426 [Xylaria grammica]|uniref:Rhodopsin domain-containing protein n=1 Tax=Xylaria grammica TaxID=363999 RepID=A0A439D2M7_9PEZI|nr:hypothetical protein EKO27_g6426 [Xylaria grammica]